MQTAALQALMLTEFALANAKMDTSDQIAKSLNLVLLVQMASLVRMVEHPWGFWAKNLAIVVAQFNILVITVKHKFPVKQMQTDCLVKMEVLLLAF